jgi:hypothetical protein
MATGNLFLSGQTRLDQRPTIEWLTQQRVDSDSSRYGGGGASTLTTREGQSLANAQCDTSLTIQSEAGTLHHRQGRQCRRMLIRICWKIRMSGSQNLYSAI